MFENYTRVYESDRNMQRALFIKLLNQKSTILTKNHHDDIMMMIYYKAAVRSKSRVPFKATIYN